MKNLIIISLLLFTNAALGQHIVITKYPRKVPDGKKWVLTKQMNVLVELNASAFVSGSPYNASLNSNPRILSTIVEGDVLTPNILYDIEFEGIAKVAYSNSVTFKISDILGFRSRLLTNILESSKEQSLTFYPGDRVSVNGILESIQLLEMPISNIELQQAKNKKIQEQNEEANKLIAVKANRKQSLTDNYEKRNRDIIEGRSPLKFYDRLLDFDNRTFNLPINIEFNDTELAYNIQEQQLLNLLDTIGAKGRVYIKFDKEGNFLAIFDDSHIPYNISSHLTSNFKSAISLIKPVQLLFKQQQYPVEFETDEFTKINDVQHVYKKFAFIPEKKHIRFLDSIEINSFLQKDIKSPLGKEIELLPIHLMEELSLRSMLKMKAPILNKDQEFRIRSEVYSSQIKHYWSHFRVQDGNITFRDLGRTYVGISKVDVLRKGLYKAIKDSYEVVAQQLSEIHTTEIINKIYIYNQYLNRIEMLY